MPGLGPGHLGYLAILLVIVLIIWGPGKLPDIGSGMGRAIREFRKATSETREEFHKATQPGEAEATATAAAPAAPVPGAAVPVGPAPLVQPAPVGGGASAAGDRAAGDSEHTTAV